MACKGGHNLEFHNHNDVGHFIYEGMGTMFFTDLGAGEYKKGYFGEGSIRCCAIVPWGIAYRW